MSDAFRISQHRMREFVVAIVVAFIITYWNVWSSTSLFFDTGWLAMTNSAFTCGNDCSRCSASKRWMMFGGTVSSVTSNPVYHPSTTLFVFGIDFTAASWQRCKSNLGTLLPLWWKRPFEVIYDLLRFIFASNNVSNASTTLSTSTKAKVAKWCVRSTKSMFSSYRCLTASCSDAPHICLAKVKEALLLLRCRKLFLRPEQKFFIFSFTINFRAMNFQITEVSIIRTCPLQSNLSIVQVYVTPRNPLI